MKMIKIIAIFILGFILCGCELSLSIEKERDKAIEDCKNAGGTPFVENYDDSHLRPIVHCRFDELKDSDD